MAAETDHYSQAFGYAFMAGVRACLGVPAAGLFFSFIGFGAVAHEQGFSFLAALASTIMVWALPGQVAHAELYGAGASLGIIFIAVALANMRMLPMVVTGLHVALGGRKLPFLLRCMAMHFMAVTGWTYMMVSGAAIPTHQRLPHFLGFVSLLYTSGIVGTIIGYSLKDWVPAEVLKIAIFMTPVYLLLLICGARQRLNQLAVVLGIVIGVGLYPLLQDWAVMIAGLIGGSIAFFSDRFFAHPKGQG